MEPIKRKVLLSSAYLAPVQYYAKITCYEEIIIEKYESYLKQSYRTRTTILGANGLLQLSLPVAGGPKAKGIICDLRLSYDHNWQKEHWAGIKSAYGNSPFFEYYRDELAPFFHLKKWSFLIDFNSEIQDTILKSLNFTPNLHYSTGYIKENTIPIDTDDFRYRIHPKPQKQATDPSFQPVSYLQVFNDRWGFVPNLGILDLLFNEGPNALTLLKLSKTT